MNRIHAMMSATLASLLLLSIPAYGGGHSWRFNEIFSNPDGSIMFIEFEECCGATEEYLVSHIRSTANLYLFPTIIDCGGCSTANAHLLVATQGFKDLPDAPAPDYILPDGFFDITGDTLEYAIYDTMIHGPLPTNGVNSLLVNGSAAVNTPTNLNGDTANVIARCKSADYDFSGSVTVTDQLRLLSEWGPCPPPCDMDIDFSGSVDVTDLLELLSEWGNCLPS